MKVLAPYCGYCPLATEYQESVGRPCRVRRAWPVVENCRHAPDTASDLQAVLGLGAHVADGRVDSGAVFFICGLRLVSSLVGTPAPWVGNIPVLSVRNDVEAGVVQLLHTSAVVLEARTCMYVSTRIGRMCCM